MYTWPSKTAPVYAAGTVHGLLPLGYTDGQFASFGLPPEPVPGFMTFFDPGWNIIRLREAVACKGFFYHQTWYDDQPFATLNEVPRYRQLQMEALKDSFGKTFPEQQALVLPDEEIPTARIVLMGMAIHFLATGERLFSECWNRCVDQTSEGRVSVARFGRDGLRVDCWFPGYSFDALAVVLSRKF